MWIKRSECREELKNKLLNLNKQVLLLQGARQVGKTALVLEILKELELPNIKVNLMYNNDHIIDGVNYFGRSFFGKDPNGEEFVNNLHDFSKNNFDNEFPIIVFLDEVDRYPQAIESVQFLAEYHQKYKFIFTGSNLENLATVNAATGRKLYFDLYPLSFLEFLQAMNRRDLYDLINDYSLKKTITDYYHKQALDALELYLRLGGMPKIITSYLSENSVTETVRDLANSIEENVKLILGDKSKLYEYQDVLRIIAQQSLDTLKLNKLQVQHAGRSEAKRLLNKTVGARVVHKIRLWESRSDLSKYVVFDTGITNFLLAGADLLTTQWQEKQKAIMLETFVANSLVNQTSSRDDIFYWKSGNKAEVEFCLHSPSFVGIDVKAQGRASKCLNSMAIYEKDLSAIIQISPDLPKLDPDHVAKLPNVRGQRSVKFINLPFYLAPKIQDVLRE